jgi:hypothetical protein
VVDENEIILIVQEDKRYIDATDPRTQLVVAAIAGFYQNNLRRGDNSLPMLKSQIMAGMTICGTSPKFYKIPITQDLVDCVLMGVEPITETNVLLHVPLFTDGFNDGMDPLRNRLLAL